MKSKIILGVCGGVAAYKSAELARLLVKGNYDVKVIMTDSAKKFITPLTFQAITGNPVISSLWESENNNAMDHISLSRDADMILVAPATANFIAKLNQGLCEDLLTSVCAARSCDLVVCPAMNTYMFNNPPNLRNIKQLQDDGVIFIGPDYGIQACGEEGKGRLTEPLEILKNVEKLLTIPKLDGIKILISAGATIEKIDDARAITNLSSGKMGISIANQAWKMGASVTLVKGITNEEINPKINTIEAKNHSEMERVILNNAGNNDIFISVAAVSDYTLKEKINGKIKKNSESLILELKKTNDILKNTKEKFPNLFCVGFAAESENLISFAKQKLIEKKLDMVIANEIKQTMGSETAEIVILMNHQEKIIHQMPKNEIAVNILDEIHESFQK
jgi:phosphopantothenoylcysteine decarboxylase/phosphopantothenate--cysteine ligase